MPSEMDGLIERYAIRCVSGHKDGKWPAPYTEYQREFWRQFIRDLMMDLEDEIVRRPMT